MAVDHSHGSQSQHMYIKHDCRCEVCKARAHEYYLEHQAERLSAAKARYAEKRDEKVAYANAYQKGHRAEHNAANKRYAQANPDTVNAKGHAYRARKAQADGRHDGADIAAQYLRQHGLCYWCGERVGKHYHTDHVIPLARGGSDGPENIVIACPKCNQSKGAKLPHEFSERMC